jgi:hypothetical protein
MPSYIPTAEPVTPKPINYITDDDKSDWSGGKKSSKGNKNGKHGKSGRDDTWSGTDSKSGKRSKASKNGGKSSVGWWSDSASELEEIRSRKSGKTSESSSGRAKGGKTQSSEIDGLGSWVKSTVDGEQV